MAFSCAGARLACQVKTIKASTAMLQLKGGQARYYMERVATLQLQARRIRDFPFGVLATAAIAELVHT